MIPEIVDESIEELEARLDTIHTRIRAGKKRNPWYVKDRFNVRTLLDYAKEQRAGREYQGFDAGTSPEEAREAFFNRYDYTPREVIVKAGIVFAGPITVKHPCKPLSG